MVNLCGSQAAEITNGDYIAPEIAGSQINEPTRQNDLDEFSGAALEIFDKDDEDAIDKMLNETCTNEIDLATKKPTGIFKKCTKETNFTNSKSKVKKLPIATVAASKPNNDEVKNQTNIPVAATKPLKAVPECQFNNNLERRDGNKNAESQHESRNPTANATSNNSNNRRDFHGRGGHSMQKKYRHQKPYQRYQQQHGTATASMFNGQQYQQLPNMQSPFLVQQPTQQPQNNQQQSFQQILSNCMPSHQFPQQQQVGSVQPQQPPLQFNQPNYHIPWPYSQQQLPQIQPTLFNQPTLPNQASNNSALNANQFLTTGAINPINLGLLNSLHPSMQSPNGNILDLNSVFSLIAPFYNTNMQTFGLNTASQCSAPPTTNRNNASSTLNNSSFPLINQNMPLIPNISENPFAFAQNSNLGGNIQNPLLLLNQSLNVTKNPQDAHHLVNNSRNKNSENSNAGQDVFQSAANATYSNNVQHRQLSDDNSRSPESSTKRKSQPRTIGDWFGLTDEEIWARPTSHLINMVRIKAETFK